MFKTILDLLKKRSVKNGIWLYALQFFNMIVPLLTIPYITRILGSSGYGTFAKALNIVGYLQTVVEFGFGMSATRKVALNGKNNIDKTFTAVLAGRFLLLISCLLFSIVYFCLNIRNLSLCFSYLILLICLIGYCVQMNWIFQGMQEMKYISIVNIIGRVISTSLIFLLVKNTSDVFLYSFLYSISPLLSGLIGLIIASKKYGLKICKISFGDVIDELKDGFYVFTTNLSSKVFGAIGVTFLGFFASDSVVGIFSAIQKIPNIMILLWAPISQVIYPISSKYFKNSFKEGEIFVKKIRGKVMIIFGLFAILVGLSSKFLVGFLFGQEYADYYYWIIPLLLWMIIGIDNNFIGIQTMLGSGHDKEYGMVFQIGVIFTIIINFLFTYFCGGLGAAFAPLISELFLNILLRYKYKKIKNECITGK